MSQATLSSAVPGSIVRKLRLVRSWKRWIHAATAVLMALAVLFAAMGVAMLVDWAATLFDSRWRYVLTNVALLAAAFTSLGWLLVAWRRGLAWSKVAGDVDREFPELEERWTTMTRLEPAMAENPQMVHPAMFRRLASEAVRWEPHVDPQQIVSLSPLIRTMLCLTAITLVLGVAVILDARQTLVLVRRFWSPGASISATELVDVRGSTVVGRGEPLLLEANVKGRAVDRALLFLQGPDEERTIKLVAQGRDPIGFSHNVRSVDEAFAYRFRAGDGQTAWYQVDVADRPEIDKLVMTITPPAYTKREAKSFDRLPRRVSVLAGSELELAVRPTIAVEGIELRARDKQVATLEKSDDGWYRWRTQLKANVSFAPLLTETHGLVNRQSPQCDVTVVADKPPAVKVLTPDDQMEVRPGDKIDITFAAQDDVGIGSAELVVYANDAASEETTPLATIPIPLDDQAGARSVQGKVELDLSQFQMEDGMELSYQVRVREDRGPVEEGRSATNSVAMASPPGKAGDPASQQAKSAAEPAKPAQPAAEQTAANQAETSQTAGNQTAGNQTTEQQSSGAQPASTPAANPPAANSQSAEAVASARPTGQPQPAESNAAKPSGAPSAKAMASNEKPNEKPTAAPLAATPTTHSRANAASGCDACTDGCE